MKHSESDSIKPNKKDLLRELENIRDTLLDEYTPPAPTSQPHLDKPITDNQEHSNAMPDSKNITSDTTHERPDLTSALEGQQSLFEEPDLISAELQDRGTQAENPFLPSHIKERLNKEKTSLQNLQNEALKHLAGQTNTDHLIDEIINQFMPEIEAELRRRLSEKFNLTFTPQANNSAN